MIHPAARRQAILYVKLVAALYTALRLEVTLKRFLEEEEQEVENKTTTSRINIPVYFILQEPVSPRERGGPACSSTAVLILF